MHTSAPVSIVCFTAAKATLAGSLPAGPFTISAPSRVAQMPSCSTAAARNVSPAPSTTFFSCDRKSFASLAMLVVLPDPFTPQTMMTVGPAGRQFQRRFVLRHQLLELYL